MAVKQTASKPEGPTGEFQGDIKVDDTLPSKSMLDKCSKLTVVDVNNKSFTFKSLCNPSPSRRVLVVFIRHFFCGNCQEYIRTLARELPPSLLSSLAIPTDLVIIGCGTPDVISMYIKETNSPYPIYADPSKKLYSNLGMIRTLSLGSKTPDYMHQSLGSLAAKSFIQELRSGRKMLSGGDFWQVGGEFIFETDGHVSWCHRMRNTRDHAEMVVLKSQLKVEGPQVEAVKSEGKTVGSRRISSSTGGLARRLSERRKSWRASSLDRNAQSRDVTPAPMDKVKEEAVDPEGKTVGSRRISSSTGGLARRLSERRKSWRASSLDRGAQSRDVTPAPMDKVKEEDGSDDNKKKRSSAKLTKSGSRGAGKTNSRTR